MIVLFRRGFARRHASTPYGRLPPIPRLPIAITNPCIHHPGSTWDPPRCTCTCVWEQGESGGNGLPAAPTRQLNTATHRGTRQTCSGVSMAANTSVAAGESGATPLRQLVQLSTRWRGLREAEDEHCCCRFTWRGCRSRGCCCPTRCCSRNRRLLSRRACMQTGVALPRLP